MTQVAKDLGMTRELLWGKMYAVKLQIFDDDDLVQQIYELNKKLQFLDEPEDEKPLETVKAVDADKCAEGQASMTWPRGLVTNVVKYGARVIGNLFVRGNTEADFLKATQNQNEYVKKTHLTNLP